MLKNEFHDILPGSSIREVYEDAEAELDEVDRRGPRRRRRAALAAIVAQRAEGRSSPTRSSSSIPRSGRRASCALRLGDGAWIIASDDVIPPLGVAVLDARNCAPPRGSSAGARLWRTRISASSSATTATIASLVHKPTGREALAGRGNQLWAYPQDKPRNWDAWDIDEDYAQSGEEIRALESLEVVETGPHYAAVRIVRRWRHSRITQTLGLAANGRRLDIATRISTGATAACCCAR